ncbi:hypothetical protein CAEBREN_15482 [Caenorhabditis brenneri]|uniref:Uncharacterized protein n=1 Tax=Caenorhabditis brenneri TaxID=135651 RepID=G0MDS1_CAEBE|nr:hypothetical protein CAEBREN_15482 [Caenorhabditis brenneri]
MAEKQMSYDSLKILLAYMDPNIRFLLSMRAPSLRKTDQIVPLHIHHLSFDHLRMTINNTEYKFGTYQYSEVVHPQVLEANQTGGVPYDLDQYGFEDISFYNDVTPGDVQIPWTDLQNMRLHLRDIPIMNRKMEFADLMTVKIWNLMMRKAQDERKKQTNSTDETEKDREIEAKRREIEQEFIALKARHNPENIPKPTETFIQLTTSRLEQEITMERFKNGKMKLHDAQKYLTSKLFGSRSLVYVKNFEITRGRINIRLPMGLKFKIENFQIDPELEISEEKLKEVMQESGHLE